MQSTVTQKSSRKLHHRGWRLLLWFSVSRPFLRGKNRLKRKKVSWVFRVRKTRSVKEKRTGNKRILLLPWYKTRLALLQLQLHLPRVQEKNRRRSCQNCVIYVFYWFFYFVSLDILIEQIKNILVEFMELRIWQGKYYVVYLVVLNFCMLRSGLFFIVSIFLKNFYAQALKPVGKHAAKQTHGVLWLLHLKGLPLPRYVSAFDYLVFGTDDWNSHDFLFFSKQIYCLKVVFPLKSCCLLLERLFFEVKSCVDITLFDSLFLILKLVCCLKPHKLPCFLLLV